MLHFVIILTLLLSVVFWYIGLFEDFKEIYTFDKPPNIACIVLKGVIRSCFRRQGKLVPVGGRRSKGDVAVDREGDQHRDRLRITLTGCRIKQGNVEMYREVCGYTPGCSVPLAYPESLFMYLLLCLVVSPSFRLAPLGLIHIKQTMTIHSGLDDLLTSPCDLEAELIEYRQVERGVEVDIKLQVLTADTNCVWEGQITLLSRNSKAQASGTEKHKNVSAPSADPAGCKVEEVGVAGDTGVQYAQVSGDWNPHHLYPWSARLLGYRRPIAHGMWTLARSLATLQDTVDQLSHPIYVEANFKRPLFMPGWCLIQYRSTGHASHWFRVADKATGVPHLIGSLKTI